MHILRTQPLRDSRPAGESQWVFGRMGGLPSAVAIVVILVVLGPVQAAMFRCPAGDVACLIAAIDTANGNGEDDMITLNAGTYTLTAVNNDTEGTNGLPSITSTITITGAGAETTVIERSASAPWFRLFHVGASGALTLDGLTVRNGRVDLIEGGAIHNRGALTVTHSTIADNIAASGGGGGIVNADGAVDIDHSTLSRNHAEIGGAILNFLFGTVNIIHSTITGNDASAGGALANSSTSPVTIAKSTIVGNTAFFRAGGIAHQFGPLMIINSTIAHNYGGFEGGGISNFLGAVTVTNSTIAGNSVDIEGGGILTEGGTVALLNTILARNASGAGLTPDCAGDAFTSLGHNLVGAPGDCDITLQATDLVGDPGLGPFTDGGTPGHGHFPPLAASRAIDAGDEAMCRDDPLLATDELGQPRVGGCDIGAIEFQGALELVNDSVTFVPMRSTLRSTPDPAGCPEGFVGKFRFEARLTNTSPHGLSGLFAEVITMTRGNLLQNADGGPGGKGARLTIPEQDALHDGILSPEEHVDVPFVICLAEHKPFRFEVDVRGLVPPGEAIVVRAHQVGQRRKGQ
jgi:hypothetical protein